MRKAIAKEQLADLNYLFRFDGLPVSNQIGKRIKACGLTVREAAERIGISRQAMGLYMRGELQPAVDVALKLSLLLEIPVEELFTLKESAWMVTAKDKKGKTIYYDHLEEELISGEAMKGKAKTSRFNSHSGETLSSQAFEQTTKQAEKNIVYKARQESPNRKPSRDSLAKMKEAVRFELEEQYPVRFTPLYTPIEPIVRDAK